MRYEESTPSPVFLPYVESLWAFELPNEGQLRPHVIVPDGTVSLSITDMGAHTRLMLTGPQTKARRVDVVPGVSYRGIRFRAGAVRAALGIDIAPLVDTAVRLETLHPDLAAVLSDGYRREAGLSGFAAQVEAALRPDQALLNAEVDALARAIIAAEGEARLAELMRRGALGPRQLRRRFVSATGLTPKTFARLRRVRRACIGLAAQGAGALAALSADAGYADQPHFSREMRDVFDMSPQMLHAYLRQISHHNVR